MRIDDEAFDRAAKLQGWTYLVSGVWPVLNIRSFEAVTGPKVDRWLVKTVGLLLATIGAAELRAIGRGDRSEALAVIGAGSAAALLAIDVWYVARRRIRKVYLLDAALQAGLLTAWAAAIE